MSDSEGSSSSSGSESSSSASSASSRSSASSKHSAAELSRPKKTRESSSESDSGSDSSSSSKSSKHSESGGLVVNKEVVVTKKSDSESSGSESSRSSKSSKSSAKSKGSRARSASSLSAASKSSRGASSSDSDSNSSAEERRPGKVREESSHSDDSSSSDSESGSGSSSESGSSASSSSRSGSSSSRSGTSSSRSSRSSSVTSESDTELNRKRAAQNVVDEKKNTEQGQVNVDEVNLVDDSGKKDTMKRTIIDVKDLDEDPAVANNFWVKLGKKTDKVFFHRYWVPIIGTLTILLAVIFSIIIDCKLHGNTHVSYGGSFVPLLIMFLIWAVIFIVMALNRVRYAINIIRLPGEEFKFKKSLFNKEGARIGIYTCSALVMLLWFVYLILISATVDNGKWTSWKQAFVPLWISLAFILIGTMLLFKLVRRTIVAVLIFMIGGCVTALLIVIFVKVQGHYGVNATWYKALVPLWVLDFLLLILIFWHVFARAVFNDMPHFVSKFHKSKKEKPPVDGFGDQFASLPIAIAGVFMLLFQVVIVCKVEGVFAGRYYFSWSIVWLWFWLSCAFLEIWVLTYRFRPDPLTAQKLTRV